MKSRKLMCIAATVLFAVPAISGDLAAQEHLRYKLVDLGTLGGPQSFGDGGHGAGNINNGGTAVGVADTITPDPNYPNFNPLMSAFGDPFVFHAVWSKGGAALVDLGALPGTNNSNPIRISSNGLIVGASINGAIDPLTGWPEATAVLWKDGHITNLGALGGYESEAFSVNSRGQVVGFSGNTTSDPNSIFGLGTETRAFLWQDGQMQDLGTLGGPDAFAGGISEKGQVTGFSYLNSVPATNCGFLSLETGAFLWERGKMVDLGTLGGTCTTPGGSNSRGQIDGASNLAGDRDTHAFLWEKGTLTDLGTLGGTFSGAGAINEAGEIIGGATTVGDLAFHAFLWRNGVMTDLGTVGGNDCSNAFDINSRGQVVGQSFPCNVNAVAHAFLWENGNIIDLNDFVPPGSGLTLGDTEQINDRGEIFGSASLPNGDQRAFVLIPCQGDDNGCQVEKTSAMSQTSAALVMLNPRTNSSSRTERMNAIRARLTHRYLYHVLGANQPK